jgi:hypothetical protein
MRRAFGAGLAAAALLLAAGCRIGTEGSHGPAAAAREGRRIILVVVDGLDARLVTDDETPVLARLWRESPWCPGTQGRAAMPARTNVNHASLLTGVFPAVHGITGNAFWDRESAGPRKLGAAGDFLTETLFTVAGRSRPALRTAAALGKGKLALMFATSPGRQLAPGRLWGPTDAAASGRDARTGYAYDGATLDGLGVMLEREPHAFALVNLADVDRVSHGTGPRSVAARDARRATDAALGALIARLRQRADWGDTTIVITADHGFDTVTRPPIVFGKTARTAGLEGLVSVGDGGLGHIYLRARERTTATTVLLASARRLALATPDIVEALYLDRNDADGGDAHTLDGVHADWQLGHERAGDLVLVAASGAVLVDGDAGETLLPGNHGGPGDRAVPVIVVRDGPPAAGACGVPEAADVGRTLFACLGLRDAERLDGSPIPPARRGRVLAGVCP